MDAPSARVRGRRHAAGGSLLAIVMTLTTALTLTFVAPAGATGGRGHHPPPRRLRRARWSSPLGSTIRASSRSTAPTSTSPRPASAVTRRACPVPRAVRCAWGRAAAVTKIDRWGQRRVLTGLPSIAGTDGSAAIGAADVAVDHGRYAVPAGLGADPAVREQEGAPEFADQLGTLLTGTFRGRHHSWKTTSGKAAHPSYGYGPRIAADVSATRRRRTPTAPRSTPTPSGCGAAATAGSSPTRAATTCCT